MLFLRRAAVAVLMLGLSACSIYSLPGQQPAPVEPPPDHTQVTPPPAQPQTPPAATVPEIDPATQAAYQPLLQRAQQASARGDYEQALSLLERAQRIDPDSPDIYLAMARTHSARGDTAQAKATAERGLLYCVDPQQCEALRRYAR